jgi:hypothetical protein
MVTCVTGDTLMLIGLQNTSFWNTGRTLAVMQTLKGYEFVRITLSCCTRPHIHRYQVWFASPVSVGDGRVAAGRVHQLGKVD